MIDNFVFLTGNNIKMKTALNISLSFSQIIELIRQLPRQQKIKLTKELEKEAVDSKLSELLKSFKTNELSFEIVAKHTNCRDPKDNFLLDLIDASEADFLVTGDKFLIELNPFMTAKILSPNDFEKEIK